MTDQMYRLTIINEAKKSENMHIGDATIRPLIL